jgi:hypothetical protein
MLKTAILGFLIIFMSNSMSTDKEKIIFDFTSTQTSGKWSTINDVVMGGISNSNFKINSDSTATFSGNVSLENNGGFASVRTLPQDFNLEGFSGITIKVKGDGKKFKFRLRTDDNFDGISYEMNFTSLKDEWREYKFEFKEFVPVFRGRILKNVPALDPEKIKQMGFLISDKQEGKFFLTIDWIKAYR